MTGNVTFVRQCLMAVFAAAGGMAAAGGVAALLVGLGIMTRYAGIFRQADHVHRIEACICAGTIGGNLLSVFGITILTGKIGAGIAGLLFGMFVGGWIMALAELLQIFPVLIRRAELTKGKNLVVLALAFGKTVGSLYAFQKFR